MAQEPPWKREKRSARKEDVWIFFFFFFECLRARATTDPWFFDRIERNDDGEIGERQIDNIVIEYYFIFGWLL